MTGPQMRWKPHRSSFRVTFIHIVAAEILLGTFLGVVLYLDVEFPPLEHFVGVNVEEDNDKFLHLAVSYVLVHPFLRKVYLHTSYLFLLEPILHLGKDIGYEFGDFFVGGH